MSFTGSTQDAMKQVNHFWSMLDELAQNDPKGYSKLIEKQMKEGVKYRSPPKLHSCVRTKILEPKPGWLYVNICSWKRVPEPQDLSGPLSVCGGKLEMGTEENQGCFAVLDLAFNPAVLQESTKDKADIDKLYVLVLRFAQQEHGMLLSQEYSIVNCSPKSSPEDVNHRLGFRTQPDSCKQTETVSQTPDALLKQIASLQSEKEDNDSTTQIIGKPKEPINKGLIQVISTAFVEPQKPDHQLEVKTDSEGVPFSLVLTVELPKVHSMSECQLKVSKEDVLLEVEDVYYLLLEWPQNVNEDTASANFNKKKRRLTMKVDVL